MKTFAAPFMNRMRTSSLVVLLLLLVSSCSQDPNKPYSDTTTSGKVNIAGDESLKLLSDAQKDTFMGLYRYATLNLKHLPENECFKALLSDSAKVIIATRKLRPDEEAVFKARNLYPVTTRIAYDAIALIVNEKNTDTTITLNKLKAVLTGEISNWKQLNPKSPDAELNVVFDNEGSSTVRFLTDSVLRGAALGKQCFATSSNQEVIDYVQEHPHAIGVIGVSWISDGDDPATQLSLAKVKVMEVAAKDDAVFPDEYYKPYQAYIAQQTYPLIREVFMINREGRAGLGTGFVSFVAGDKGQRIIRLIGLLPATMPVRLIQTQ